MTKSKIEELQSKEYVAGSLCCPKLTFQKEVIACMTMKRKYVPFFLPFNVFDVTGFNWMWFSVMYGDTRNHWALS